MADIVVIGGSAAGLIAAKTAKVMYPDKEVAVIRKEKISMVPCGIPYIFSTLKSVDDDIMGVKPIEDLGVKFIYDEVVDIDKDNKEVITKSGDKIKYDKLVLATGSKPFVPSIEGKDLENIFVVPKDYEYLKNMVEKIKKAKRVAVIGAGFIGVEVTDEIRKEVEKVYLIEAQNRILPVAFDKDFSEVIEENLKSKGVEIKTSKRVKRFIGNGKLERIEFEDGEVIDVDAAILSVGYKPNVELAQKLGLFIGKTGAIWTDEYMRTSEKDIFACGDCVEHKDFYTRRASRLMLASTATFDARIAASNLYGIKMIRENKGNIAIFSSSIEGLTFAAAGLNETMAMEEYFDFVIGEAQTIDKHPGKLPGTEKIKIKLIFSRSSCVLIGAQILGGRSVGEIINILGLAIQKGMTAEELFTMQFGTHPLLTAPPTMYPIVLAAENAMKKMKF